MPTGNGLNFPAWQGALPNVATGHAFPGGSYRLGGNSVVVKIVVVVAVVVVATVFASLSCQVSWALTVRRLVRPCGGLCDRAAAYATVRRLMRPCGGLCDRAPQRRPSRYLQCNQLLL
jgi:hypothetical protein